LPDTGLYHDAGATAVAADPGSPTRHPDLRERIFQQQTKDHLCVLAIRLLLAYSFGPDLGGIPDSQLKLQFGQQPLKPACMSAGFHADSHLLPSQSAVKLLRLFGMRQSLFQELFGIRIHRSDFAETRGGNHLL
jgi:hypothetical protein